MKKVKAIFISDVHLGTDGSNAKDLLDFLNQYDPQQLYIVGDLIDIWQMQSKFKWKKSHTKVIEKLFQMSKNIPIYYITGNHDEEFRNMTPVQLYNIHIVDEAVYEDYLVIHGDITDIFMTEKYKWIAKIGGSLYNLLIYINRLYNKLRILCHRPYWSLSKYVKDKAKNVAKVMSNYEENLIKYTRSRGYNKVICGHIHHPEMKATSDGFVYYNIGDWVENNSAIIHNLDGTFDKITEWRK